MKITYNWLRDFVDVKLKPQDLANSLTMAGLEVTSLEKFEDDYVFEIEVTSNRPDWLSIIGIAREAAAITGKKLKIPRVKKIVSRLSALSPKPLAVVIEDKKDCPLYTVRIIEEVKVASSPEWLEKRIEAIGLKPVNNIVDITNYILFLTGQPLHAFDLDKIKGDKIIVRRARAKERIVTISGEGRELGPDILVIADAAGPLAVAGIMGGKESEVSASTRNILLESAYFSPAVTRRASRLLGISSDSSYRFERSVDITKVAENSGKAALMISELAAGRIGRFYKSGSSQLRKKQVTFNSGRAGRFIGKDLPKSKIKSIFRALGFKIISAKGNSAVIEAPAFRQDINCEADLVEEACRIYGYDNIPLTRAAIKPQAVGEDKIRAIQEIIRGVVVGAGFSEVVNYSLISRESLGEIRFNPDQEMSLENPLSQEQEILRPSLSVGLLGNLSRNLESGNSDCRFFEIGSCFREFREDRILGLAANKMSFLELKGVLELLLLKLGISGYQFKPSSGLAFAGGQSADLYVAGKKLGFISDIVREVLSRFKIGSPNVHFAQVDLEKLKVFTGAARSYKAVPKYPSVLSDLSLVVEENVNYQQLLDEILKCDLGYLDSLGNYIRPPELDPSALEIIKSASGSSKICQKSLPKRQILLEAVNFKDIYRSDALGQGKKSVTVTLEFRSSERTLTDQEVNSYLGKIVEYLGRSLKASIR